MVDPLSGDRDGICSGSKAISGAHVWHRSKEALLGAAGRLTSSQMPVVRAILNGRCSLCLVDTGSECTLVSARVVVGYLPRKGRPFVTADGRTSHVGKYCRVIVGLQGHCFSVTGLVVPGLDNLGVDCLLGNDIVDHMGGVSVKRASDSKYVVVWGKPHPAGCCRGPGSSRSVGARPVGRAVKSASVASGVSPQPLEITDKDFVATFANGRWIVR